MAALASDLLTYFELLKGSTPNLPLGRDLIRNICGKFGVDPFSVLEKKFKICQPIRGQGGHFGFRIDLKSNNT